MRSTRAGALRGSAGACAALLLVATAATAPSASAAPSTAVTPVAGTPIASSSVPDDWHLAPSLTRLRAEVDSRWPGRSRTSDGALGDPRHRMSRNSHNPVGDAKGPEHGTSGAVHALDITAAGIDTEVVLRAVVGDPRVWYVIFDGRIWSRTTGWTARRQAGDPHTTHIHVSLRDSSQAVAVAAERDTRRWLAPRSAGPKRAGRASLGTRGTVALQRALLARGYRIPSGATGWYGPETTKAVRAFQLDQGWSGSDADGKAGTQTLRMLGVTPSAGGSDKPSRSAAAKKAKAKAKKATAKKAKAKAKKTTAKKAKAKAKKTTAKKAKAKAKKATAKKAKSKAAKKAKPKAAKGTGGYVPGTASTAVYYLQEALIERGYSIPAGPTGFFGRRTVEAVKQFQRDQGWTGTRADGTPGRATLARLGL